MDPEATFVGQIISPGEEKQILAESDEDCLETIHLTQLALGDKPVKGPHTIFIENEDGKFAIGTLDREKCTHFSVDITIANGAITVSHTGQSDIHITGYKTTQILAYEDYDDEDDPYMLEGDSEEDSEEEESNDEEDESSEDEEAPQAVPISAKKSDEYKMLVEDEASEESSDDEDEDDDEDDSSEEEGSDDSDDEEESSEEEEEPAPANGKRKQALLQTPQPVKKSKPDTGKVAPATAPAKVGAKAKAPASEAEYADELKKFLQKNGATKLAALGGAVPKPTKNMKVKKFLENHSSVFAYNAATDVVSLKK